MTLLTTHYEWNLAAQLKLLPCTAPVCFLSIISGKSRTGCNEEQGRWIVKFWCHAIANNIEGHRVSWSELVLFTQHTSAAAFQNIIINLLKSLTCPNLASFALFSVLQGNYKENMKEIERMQLQLCKRDYWQEHLYSVYYKNGLKVFFKKTC